jgi:hypothetical protein
MMRRVSGLAQSGHGGAGAVLAACMERHRWEKVKSHALHEYS